MPTTTIVLVREHAERIRPPRCLWVPFEFGRPFGPPSNAAFQRQVLMAALNLLVSAIVPGTIVDFPEEDPSREPDKCWSPPLAPLSDGRADADTIAAGLAEEIGALAPFYAREVAKWGRTTVGLASLAMPEIGAFIAVFLRDRPRISPIAGASVPIALRFAADDLKAYYLEAATAGSGAPSSRQLTDWFWEGTWAGRALFAIRARALAGEDYALKTVAGHFLVPVSRLP